MSKFDYTTKAIVGVANQYGLTPHAQIDVIGYLEGGILHRLNHDAAIAMFPPRGDVFAHNMFVTDPEAKGNLIQIQVKPNTNLSDSRNSDFIWDKSGSWRYYGDKVIKEINMGISADGGSNFDFLRQKGYLDSKKDIFFTCGSFLYWYNSEDAQDELLKWDLNNISTQMKNSLISAGDNIYIIDNLDDDYEIVDVYSNTQLLKWFFKNVLKDIGENVRCEDFKSKHANATAKALAGLNLPSNIYESRLKRLANFCENITLSEEMFQEIAKSSWLNEAIQKALETYSVDALEEKQAEIKKQLQDLEFEMDAEIESAKLESAKAIARINNETDKKISEENARLDALLSEREDLNKEIRDKKKELDDLVILCEERENHLLNIEDKASRIAEDFKIIKEVLNIQGSSQNDNEKQESQASSIQNKALMHEIVKMGMLPAMQIKALAGNLKYALKVNNRSKVEELNLVGLLLNYKMLMLPDGKIAKSILEATGNYTYLLQYVDVKWTSFTDLWNNGFSELVMSAEEDNDTMHYLVLQNINLTYLPSLLQPIIDIIIGLTHVLPSGHRFPSNIRILCISSDTEGIVPATQCLKYMGCLEKKNYMENEEDDVTPVSTTMKVPTEYIPSALFKYVSGLNPNSDYLSYITNEE